MTLLELASADASLRVDLANGGRIASLRVFGEELLVGPLADPLAWGCYPLGPWAGRLAHGRFSHDGSAFRTPVNFPPHAIHGTLFDRPWQRLDERTIASSLGPHWPFPGRAIQRFHLADDHLTVEFEMHSLAESFPAVIGFHPWFRRRLGAGAPAELAFHARARHLLDADGVPTGEIAAPGAPPWDDCFTGVDVPPRLRWPGVLELEIGAGSDCWVVYTRPAHAVCVEPWSAPPDAANRGMARRVAPGSPLRLALRLAWRRAPPEAARGAD